MRLSLFIYVHVIISSHHKSLIYSNSTVFDDTVIQSRYHRAVNFFDSKAIRRQCEGFA